jgi:hypothetical protein
MSGITYKQFDEILQKAKIVNNPSRFFNYFFTREIDGVKTEFCFTVIQRFAHIPPEISISVQKTEIYSYYRKDGLFHSLFVDKNKVFIQDKFFEDVFNEVDRYLNNKIKEIDKVKMQISSEVYHVVKNINQNNFS